MKKTKNYSKRNFKKIRASDVLSTKKRSALMSKIRSKDTKFEREFIAVLETATRKKFQTNVNSIKGKPDIVFSKDKICVFLDSDFWHGWQYPRWKHLLKNDFWRTKIERNRTRDRRTTQFLKNNDWKVLRLWEHSINADVKKPVELIQQALSTK